MSKEEDMQKTLVVEFNGIGVEWNRTTNTFDQQFGGYTQLDAKSFYTQQDIDLSGYAMDKKTFFPYSSFEQRAGATFVSTSTPLAIQPYVIEKTIVSSVPLSEYDISLTVSAIVSPGFNYSIGGFGPFPTQLRFDRTVIIHGENKLYTIDSTMEVAGQSNAFRLIDRQTFSSLEPTAADKLYCYRILYFSSAGGEMEDSIIPDSRIIIPGTLASEPKLEYMMRLKRSYELANQV